MTTTEQREAGWREYLSPLRLTLLAVNGVCFGGSLVLLALGNASGPVIVLTIGTGLSFGALVAGAITASRRVLAKKDGS
ncbi:MAG: hypothetical protein M1541_01720 [Acidobacteria bacterium]|nr:hypothetical protein [Acidobacteriota bacterium]